MPRTPRLTITSARLASTADLEGIYRQVAFQVPCPAEVYWARR